MTDEPKAIVMPELGDEPDNLFFIGSNPGDTVFFIAAEPAPSFTFWLAGNVEFMRVEADGRVFVRGTLVDTDAEVYRAFRELLGLAPPA